MSLSCSHCVSGSQLMTNWRRAAFVAMFQKEVSGFLWDANLLTFVSLAKLKTAMQTSHSIWSKHYSCFPTIKVNQMKNLIILNELLKLNLYFIAWIHCSICSCCALPDHSCKGPKDGCFICGELGHKRSTCSNISASKKVNKAVRKRKQRRGNKMKWRPLKDNPWICYKEEEKERKSPSISLLLNVQWFENKKDL